LKTILFDEAALLCETRGKKLGIEFRNPDRDFVCGVSPDGKQENYQ
jgi:hypothetical protein